MRMHSPTHKHFLNYLKIFITVCLSLGTVELLALHSDYPSNGIQRQHLPESIVSDPVVGWKHRPGTYRYVDTSWKPPRVFHVTYRDDGARFCGSPDISPRPYVGLLGCSFMEGFGLDDTESLGGRLQERLPSYSVENFGVAGYGTYQSLLSFLNFADQYQAQPGSIVVYGFADFHAHRNVKSPLLQRTWQMEGIFPVCDESTCFYWIGKRMSGWWRMSRTLSLIENSLDTLRMVWNQEIAEKVTERLLIRLRDAVAERGLLLLIAPMTPLNSKWDTFFRTHGFDVAPCFIPDYQSADFRLPDGHPNAKWTERYSECLSVIISSRRERTK